MSFNGRRQIPPPVNEPVRSYAPGSPERAELKARLSAMAAERIDIPMVIDGQDERDCRERGEEDGVEAVVGHRARQRLLDGPDVGHRELGI